MVQVFDFGQYEGRYFIAMEYVPGRSLRQLGRSFRLKQRRLPRKFFLRAMLDVVRALSYGHGLTENGVPVGFVHRDVSPENVMISYAGATKLIDFGAAATTNTPPPSSSVVGKLRYLSPERLRGNVGDARSDLYSVGIMLYEYLAGISPFDGQDMVKKIIEGQAPDITTKVNVPPTVARVVRRAMAADLRKRYGWADRLADEIDRVAGERPRARPVCRRRGRRARAPAQGRRGDARGAGGDAEGQTARLRVLPPVVGPGAPDAPRRATRAAAPPARRSRHARCCRTPRPAAARSSNRRSASTTSRFLQQHATHAGRRPPRAPRRDRAPPARARAAARPAAAPGRPPPGALSDPFSVVRRAGVNPVAAWVRGAPPETALPQSPPTNSLSEDEAVAAACFDRGLSLVSERRPLDAVLYWERAVALAPAVAMYQEQLRRLVTQIRDEKDGGGSPTPTPRRTSIRKAD